MIISAIVKGGEIVTKELAVICRFLAFVAILAFVFALVYVSNNYKFLWFLLLLPTCEFIPCYETPKQVSDAIAESIKNDKRR